ncbi:unnamed protein product [Hermetia illucens]|uniref:Uncharacterized protein n=2 Tax=Hermetia illucens TaxID=343691 RepID=A0A7R8UC71_HERIL|nr:unnamed protein product [Hermetia illucens]
MVQLFILYVSYLVVAPAWVFADDECSKLPLELENTPRDCCQPPKFAENLENNCENATNIFCQYECTFNESRILQNDGVKTTDLKAHFDLELKSDPDYIPIAIKAVQTCYTLVKQKMGNKDQIVGGCSVLPSLVATCTDNQIFVNCPPNKWKTDPLCEAAKAFLKKCPVRNFPISN